MNVAVEQAVGGRSHAPPSIPEALVDVALVDAKTAAAVGGMGISWWLDEVKEGRAPAPAIREPRLTRWRLVDVREFWRRRAQSDTQASNLVVARAKKASDAARAKRRAQRPPVSK
jgi:hypothetical protein